MYKIIENYLKSKVESWIKYYMENNLEDSLKEFISQGYLDQRIKDVVLTQYIVFGDDNKLQLSPSCVVNNALFNLSSGNISVGDYVFFGHNVSLITGTHNYTKFGLERMEDFPEKGNDIFIEEGVWIASNVTVIGPCQIGKHSVVAAGSVVKGNIPSYHVVAGIPAKAIKEIQVPD
ncbi:MAG: acyltransferase [Cyanomargarita calcarea GSE-NOS-MK-12-04C]|jgi:acetyltransferase-like isoleucine patch superfamily enzyme|uniref:Acyltransferase n=1 Tax=Cyanomargarita calcarea GSE-NOS-MK-12-04C TaxID=2839659 RepID=A0A951UV66_9CYAN|nr:acyltransferase [Cyanomargarita calcarea GSE-NOS-MK-12-04C]